MARATYAKCLVALGGTLPSPWVEGTVTALDVRADYIIDGYTSPEKISTTSNEAIELAVDVVLRLMRQVDMLRQSSGSTSHDGRSYDEVVILTDEIKSRIDGLLKESYSTMTTIDLINTGE